MARRDPASLEIEDPLAPGPLSQAPPQLSLEDASTLAAEHFGVDGRAARLESERDANFRIDADEAAYVLKVYNAAERAAVVEMQEQAMLHVAAADPALQVPRIVSTRRGDLHAPVALDGRMHLVHLTTFLSGERAEPDRFDGPALHAFGALVARVGRALRGFFHPAADRQLLWDLKHASRLRALLGSVADPARATVAARALDRFEERVLPALPILRAQVIHNDLTYDNVLVDADRRPVAVVDFGDTTHSPALFDLAVALASFTRGADVFERVSEFVRGYGESAPLDAEEAELLADAVSARMAASVLISAWRARQFAENVDYITAFDAGTWPVLERFDELGAAKLRRRFRRATASALAWRPPVSPRPSQPADELVRRRRRAFGAAMSPPSYDRPLHVVRADGVWMHAADGRCYLDAYNNVPVVGHSHPRVVAALAAQARLLNTNTRYLHETALELAERLAATMPPYLDTCLFVNSGSEANELAWRLATGVTEGTGGVVSRWAYHGVTAVQTDLSPSEWAGERPSYVELVQPPDGYRGAHRRNDAGWELRHAESVRDAVAALAERGHPTAAMFADAGWTSDGIFTDAPAYLDAAASTVREAGGLFVADEVQTGFGRFGSSLWGFATAGADPDFVTLGKPMGNGHPVAAVVTRAAIAEEFARLRTPIFSTFGGNPVACAAALAVLDVIEEERLLESASDVGAYLRSGVETVAGRHPLVGDIRGRGLLLGVDLVDDQEARTPATGAARAVVNGLRERGVLVGLTGRDENVLKIRPPLVFGREHADRLVEALDDVLAEFESAIPFPAAGRAAQSAR
ncbi:MAG: aminotransferase class III-fold pyridoxal phosphate-dependent enzyme [Actinomycetota bacterium]|nr:aminotransferase class III-fold pyridoxal phosphate-dependent enzyme [Actinomycetota bacterium]